MLQCAPASRPFPAETVRRPPAGVLPLPVGGLMPAGHTHADGFLARVRELPDADEPRLIYADWLDEQGDPRGEFIRAQVALARLPEYDRRRARPPPVQAHAPRPPP